MNIIIVEDDAFTLSNLEFLLKGESGIETVEAYPDCREAIDHADWETCDILLTDIDLPKMSGVELIEWLQVNHPDVASMAYTVFDKRDTVFSAIKAGACGYLLKGASPRELVDSLREVYEGGAPMSPPVARKVIQYFQDGAYQDNLLTAKEQDVLRGIEKGHSYKEVATELSISPHTVHSHIKTAYEKVKASSREELLQKARRMGWI